MKSTTRRGLLGAIAIAPAALATIPAAAASNTSADPLWPKLVDDFRAKYAVWLATIKLEEDAEDRFSNACSSLPPEPAEPSVLRCGLPDNIEDMTLRQIKASTLTPEAKIAWAAYDRDHAAWKAQRAALYERLVGPAKAACNRMSESRCDTFNGLRIGRLGMLRA